MTTTFCPTLTADPAVMFVDAAQAKFLDFADRAYKLALEQDASLRNFTAAPINFSVSFDFAGQLAPFERPQAPTVNRGEFALQAPAAPAGPAEFVPQTLPLAEFPDYDLTPPSLGSIERPNAPAIAEPVPPPASAALVIPDAPDTDLPPLPTFEALNLPAVPALELPMFSAVQPGAPDLDFTQSWDFQPGAYVSTLRDRLTAKVEAWLADGTALPPSIERALFDRGRAEIEAATEADIAQVWDEFGARGFMQPPGRLAARVDGRRKEAQDRLAAYNREVRIEAFREALANVRLALQQGIALEGLAVNLHIEEQRLLLSAAQFQRETAIALLNARISAYNARLEGYRTEAQVFAEKLRALLARVELYRAQIEGERARGEINEQRARVYAEQVRALGVLADLYRSRVEGVKTQAEAQRAVIERFRAEVDAYRTRWDAYRTEWDGYRAAAEAENARATVHRNLVEAYGLRVQAAAQQNRTLTEREQLRIQQWQQGIEAYKARITGYQAAIEAERSRLQALLQGVQAETAVYGARAAVEQAASAAADRSFQLGLERARADVDTQLKRAEVLIQQNVQLLSLVLENLRTRANVAGQLAASSMSAVNASSSVSSSRGESKSCSTSLSYSGEAADLA